MAKLHVNQRLFGEKIRAGEALKYTLTCITDGGVLDFFDEGPFPVADGKPNKDWKQKDPTGRRQNLLKQLRKQVAIETDDGRINGEFHVWVHAARDANGKILPIVLNNDAKAGPVGPCVKSVDDKGKVTLTKAEVPPPVWEQAFGVNFPVPLADEAWLEAHALLLQNRAKAHDRGGQSLEAAIREEKEKRVKKPAPVGDAA